LLNVDDLTQQPRVVWERSAQDRYNDPGQPVMRTLANGQRVMWQHGNHIYLNGQGASRLPALGVERYGARVRYGRVTLSSPTVAPPGSPARGAHARL